MDPFRIPKTIGDVNQPKIKLFGVQNAYNEAKFIAICNDLMNGLPGGLKRICSSNAVSVPEFYSWLHENEELMKAYKIAREFQTYGFIDDILEATDNPLDDPKSIAEVTLRKCKAEMRLKLMEKLNQKDFGKKIEETVKHEVKHEMNEDQFLKLRNDLLNRKKPENTAEISDAEIIP